jgi:hypothetical protein
MLKKHVAAKPLAAEPPSSVINLLQQHGLTKIRRRWNSKLQI